MRVDETQSLHFLVHNFLMRADIKISNFGQVGLIFGASKSASPKVGLESCSFLLTGHGNLMTGTGRSYK